ncbi:ATP-binding protein [Sphaerisporangium perillae]|uniref:ATP-binding protein n=1 Tax=Sphaerisporangium perillae TaxID=2935860 RepID=UPI00200F6E3F|nr:ATP-binding protein [Sphaerisporangium perillae]
MRAEQPVPKEAHHRTGVLARERPPDGPQVPFQDTFRVLVTMLRPGSASRCARAAVREALSRAGVTDEGIGDAEIIVAELAANAEKHAHGPYELRIHCLSGIPMWCEMVDGGRELGEIPAILTGLQAATLVDLAPFAESGRGLLLAHRLSHGHCYAYPTTMSVGGAAGKAVAFALPTPASGGKG